MQLAGGTPCAAFAARRRRVPAGRFRPVTAAATGDGPAAPRPPKPPTRKRMIDAMMRAAESRPPPQAPLKGKKRGSAKPAQAPAQPADDEVLDLSAFLSGDADELRDEEGTADSFGGEEDEEEDFGADGDDDGSFLSLAGEAGEAAEAGVLNTWQFDSDVGELVYKRVQARAARPSAAASSAALAAMLARLERGEADDEDDSDEFDVTERGLEDATLRVPTRLQKVDTKDVDEVIDALAGLDTGFLDKESQRLLDEELDRKRKEKEKQMRRVVDRNNAPPEGRRKTHRQLQIIAGSAANYKLWSPQDLNTRPMMAAVRGAVFSMLTSLTHGNGQTAGTFPPSLRWLDLFAGTGAVGIEALSRGCASAHFVELDPWIVTNCLQRNLEHTRTAPGALVHVTPVETFIAGALSSLRVAGGAPFNFISVCPPYEKVSYPELLASLEASPLVIPGTILVVEYPKYERKHITDRIGRLEKIRDRAYGRTLVAVYEALDERDSCPRREAAAAFDAELLEEQQGNGVHEDDVAALGR